MQLLGRRPGVVHDSYCLIYDCGGALIATEWLANLDSEPLSLVIAIVGNIPVFPGSDFVRRVSATVAASNQAAFEAVSAVVFWSAGVAGLVEVKADKNFFCCSLVIPIAAWAT